ncbi:MAG: hypothetical protein ACI8WT_000381 [Clostridium sp.]|jgi:hypothetical protein
MRNIKNKLAHFMYGRYGTDQLYIALMGAYFTLIVANSFINSKIISSLMSAVLIWIIFRAFSRNIDKRRLENKRFMKIWNPARAKISLPIRRVKEIKTRRFRKCPHCKTVLRLPRKTGKHTVKCPTCNKEFELRILW